MHEVGIMILMQVVEDMTIARGAWEVRGVEVEVADRVGVEIGHSSLQPHHGRVMRTNSWEEAIAAEGEGHETDCQVGLGLVEDPVEGQGYRVDLGIGDNGWIQSYTVSKDKEFGRVFQWIVLHGEALGHIQRRLPFTVEINTPRHINQTSL
jgi:hypothetical protein